MTKEKKKVTLLEFEPGGELTGLYEVEVAKQKFIGENQFGRPEAVEEQTKSFSTMEKAIKWALKDRDWIYGFEVGFNQMEVEASIEGGVALEDQVLVLKTNGMEGKSPRMVDDHHSVSTDGRTFMHISIGVGDRDTDTMFDRGLAWLDVTDLKNPKFIFNLMPGKHTVENLVKGFTRLTERSTMVLTDLAMGMNEKKLLPKGSELIKG